MIGDVDPVDVATTLVDLLKAKCPIDENNLIQTIGFEISAEGQVRVFIGGDALLKYAKAPYAKYTNEREGLHYRAKFKGQELTGWINNCLKQLYKIYGGM